VSENTSLRLELKERYGFANMVGTSRAMQEVYEQVAQVAPTNTTVLLRGESGTGKELIAHAIHYNSAPARKPFIKVSCAALPQDLIEVGVVRLRKRRVYRRARPKRDASSWPKGRSFWTKSASSTWRRR
jgi:transcriptional regulator of aromatic amino acid metabolism